MPINIGNQICRVVAEKERTKQGLINLRLAQDVHHFISADAR